MYVKLTNMTTNTPIWINPFWVAHIDEIRSGSRIVMNGVNTGITRIVKEAPEDILKAFEEAQVMVNTTEVQLTPC